MVKKELYAYLNINNPMVAWEVAIGRVRSACDFGLENGGFGMSLWYYSLLKECTHKKRGERFAKEMLLENERSNNFPSKVSRLRGMYFFKSENDAKAALDRWGVSRNGRYISKINFSATALTEVDSEWITSCLKSEDTNWMNKYWNGDTYGIKPLTEIIASGIGTVQNEIIRQAAYWRVVERFPDVTPLLAMAACGFARREIESIAQIVPALTDSNGKRLVAFHIYLEDLKSREQDIIDAVEECKERNEVPMIVSPKDQGVFFKIPDLRDEEFPFREEKIQETINGAMNLVKNGD